MQVNVDLQLASQPSLFSVYFDSSLFTNILHAVVLLDRLKWQSPNAFIIQVIVALQGEFLFRL